MSHSTEKSKKSPLGKLKRSAPITILKPPSQPSEERISKLKHWLVSQAVADTKPVAVIALIFTADGVITTSEVGVEPAHAQAMLPAIQSLAKRLESQMLPARPTLQLIRRP